MATKCSTLHSEITRLVENRGCTIFMQSAPDHYRRTTCGEAPQIHRVYIQHPFGKEPRGNILNGEWKGDKSPSIHYSASALQLPIIVAA